MNDLVIRSATILDIEFLKKFEQGVISEERPFNPTLKKEETHYYDLEALIKSDDIEIVVAEVGNELIGCGFSRIETAPPYLSHDRFAYLAYMYVIPEFRRKGVNRQIIEALKSWSLSKDVDEFRLKVYVENVGAIEAYKQAGFKELTVEMRMNTRDL